MSILSSDVCPRCAGRYRFDAEIQAESWACVNCGHRVYLPQPTVPIKTEDRAERQYCTNCFSDKRLEGYKICTRCYRANQRAHQTARRNRMTLNQEDAP